MSESNSIHAVNYSLLMDLIGYSQSKLEKLADRFDDLIFRESFVSASELAEAICVSKEQIEASKSRLLRAFEQCIPGDIQSVSIKSSEYPPLLRKVHRPPQILFLRGRVELLQTRSVSVVGSRGASPEGLLRAQRVALALAANDYTVVSGLAKGIDAAAHTAILKCGGNTIGVIGTPIDQAYPRENAHIQEKIATGNLLVSQFPLAQPGSPYNFPTRNHTMCGLSLGTVIVEATETSGALHQAKSCIKEKRKLFIMKSLLEKKELSWPRKFVNEGAIVLDDIDTLLRELEDAQEPNNIQHVEQLKLTAG